VRVLALLLVGSIALAAWFAGSGRSAAAGHGWSRTSIGAVSQPAPAGGKFVLYAQQNGSLEVVALDATDGSTAWVAPASPSDVTAGVPAFLAVRTGTVFYLQGFGSPGGGLARVVARDAASGNVVWQSAVGTFDTWPEICADQTDAVCVNGRLGGGVGFGQLRFSTATGKVVAVVKMGTPAFPGRELTPDLFDPGQRDPEQLLAVRKGNLAWRHRLSAIFTLPHATSDGGWDFDRLGRLDLFVGSVFTRPKLKGNKSIFHLNPSMTAGFSTATGRVKWRAPGYYACGQPLPCAGRSQAGYSSPASLGSATVGLRLVAKGTLVGTRGSVKPEVSRNASVTIQGFNPLTGKTAWSFKAGRDLPLITQQKTLPQVGPTVLVLKTRSGYVALDLRTGRTRHLAASSHAWCRKTIVYHLAHTEYYGGGRGLYAGQQGLYPCKLSTRRAAPPAKLPSLVRLIGASTGGMTAWTDAGAVHARPR
jgi:putative pyrroloquinoline-quinone binding quinoprotein